MTGLLDTNTVLYLLGGKLVAPLPVGDYGLSVISEMELLSWPSLTTQEEIKVQAFLRTVTLCDLTPGIRLQAAWLRREERLRLPDAVICATALEHQVELWTNDQRLLTVRGLQCRTVGIKP